MQQWVKIEDVEAILANAARRAGRQDAGAITQAIFDLESLEKEEMRPVVKAKWKRMDIGFYRCSNCRKAVMCDGQRGQHYCSYCGATMEMDDGRIVDDW